jgi:hypothetical protein
LSALARSSFSGSKGWMQAQAGAVRDVFADLEPDDAP